MYNEPTNAVFTASDAFMTALAFRNSDEWISKVSRIVRDIFKQIRETASIGGTHIRYDMENVDHIVFDYIIDYLEFLGYKVDFILYTCIVVDWNNAGITEV